MIYTLKSLEALAFELYTAKPQHSNCNHNYTLYMIGISSSAISRNSRKMFTHHIWTNMMPYLNQLQAIWALPPVRALPPRKKTYNT